MRAHIAAVLMILLVAVGCGAEEAPAVDIEGTWWAVQLDGEPIEIGRNTAEMPWFEITATSLGGNLGCNGGGGEYELRGDRLRVPSLVGTTELCGVPDGSEVMVPTETVLSWMLTSGATVSVGEGSMTWTGAGGHTVTFEAAASEPPPPTTTAPQSFGLLQCAPGVVLETRHGADGVSPEDLAIQIAPATVRVEAGGPLQWWGYDAEGDVTVGVFLGDVPDPDYQVVRCS